MAKIILTDAAQDGIEGAKKKELEHSEEYEKLNQETIRKIEAGKTRERKTWKEASKY